MRRILHAALYAVGFVGALALRSILVVLSPVAAVQSVRKRRAGAVRPSRARASPGESPDRGSAVRFREVWNTPVKLLPRCLAAAVAATFLGALAGDLDSASMPFGAIVSHPLRPECLPYLFRFGLWFGISLLGVNGVAWLSDLATARANLAKANREIFLFNLIPEVKQLREGTEAAMRACAAGGSQALLDFFAQKVEQIKNLSKRALDNGDPLAETEALREIARLYLFVDPKLDDAMQEREQTEWLAKVAQLLSHPRGQDVSSKH